MRPAELDFARWYLRTYQLSPANGRRCLTSHGFSRSPKEKAEIQRRVYPHGLRHTFACELLFRGVDVVTISKLLGHSSVAVTQRYLDHLTNDQAIAKLVAVDWPEVGV